jgi:hypothetical protein
MQSQAHDVMIGLFQQQATALGNPKLKEFAARALPVLIQHRTQANELRALPGIAASSDSGGGASAGAGSTSPQHDR